MEIVKLRQQISGPSLEELLCSHYILEAFIAGLPSHTKKELAGLLQTLTKGGVISRIIRFHSAKGSADSIRDLQAGSSSSANPHGNGVAETSKKAERKATTR